MGRPRQQPQQIPDATALQAVGITRERALLAERVGGLRVKKGWNWAELGGKAHMNPVQVQGIEEGEREVYLSTLVKLAKALKVHSLDELLGPLPCEHFDLVDDLW